MNWFSRYSRYCGKTVLSSLRPRHFVGNSAEDEMLSVELFDTVFEDEFSIVRPMLDALRRGNKKKVEECNDLVFQIGREYNRCF